MAPLLDREIYEPRHDKTNKVSVRPAKTDQPGHPPSLSYSSLCAQWVAKDPRFLHADSEESDQTGRMPRLICLRWGAHIFCCFCYVADHIVFAKVVCLSFLKSCPLCRPYLKNVQDIFM